MVTREGLARIFDCIFIFTATVAAIEKRPRGVIQASNYYTHLYGPVGGGEYTWIRPFKNAVILDVGIEVKLTLKKASNFIRNNSSATSSPTCRHLWQVRRLPATKNDKSVSAVVSNDPTSATTIFSTQGTYDVKFYWCGRNVNEKQISLIVHAMPVRREFRELTTAHKNRFLDAFHTLYILPSEIGQQLYGNNYNDVHDIANIHRQNAAGRESDHFHEVSCNRRFTKK